MTRFVLKWPMYAPVEAFSMPDDAVVIDVRTQNGVPTLWTLSSTESVDVQRMFIGYGTGHPIDENATYVGSAHDVEGNGLVFHIFERVTSSERSERCDSGDDDVRGEQVGQDFSGSRGVAET